MHNIKRLATLIAVLILGLYGTVAMTQDFLQIDGSRIKRTIDLFETETEPADWAAEEATDPNGRPLVPGQQRFVTLDSDAIALILDPAHTTPFRVDLEFMPDVTYTVIVEEIRLIGGATGTRHVSGRIRSDDLSRVALVFSAEQARGTVHAKREVVEIRPAGAGLSVIQVLDPNRFPRERSPRPAHRQRGFDPDAFMPFSGRVFVTAGGGDTAEPFDGEPYADLSFVPAEFTVLALKSTHDYASVCDSASLKLEAKAYTDNLVLIFGEYAIGTVTFDCVTPPLTPAWTTLESIRQYIMNDTTVQAKRDAAKADLVVMIVKNGLDFCGYAMHPDYPKYPIELYGDQYKENAAFAVVDEICALGQSSFAHEIGHLLGMKHERFNENGGVDNFCGYGYPVTRWRWPVAQTVMAYNDYCEYRGNNSCERKPFYSIPYKKSDSGFQNWLHKIFGRTKGKSCESTKFGHLRAPANNTRQLINAAELVAKYRDPP